MFDGRPFAAGDSSALPFKLKLDNFRQKHFSESGFRCLPLAQRCQSV
jgi:hypothetical protein